MNVKELREYLANFPDDMEVIIRRYSDYELLVAEHHISKERAVKFEGTGWYTRYHPRMDELKKAMARDYLLIEGN